MSQAKGYRTTEFWLSAAAFLVGALLASGVIGDGPVYQMLGLVQSTLATLGYQWARGTTKRAEASERAVQAAASVQQVLRRPSKPPTP